MSSDKSKQTLRQETWQRLRDQKAARFPFPVEGRIPNFKGSNDAGRKLTELSIWKEADTIKVNPDSPQKEVRKLALEDRKTLVVPTPRLKDGFIILEDLANRAKEASTIKGASKWGSPLPISEIPDIDLIVSGSVAVDKEGGRAGKGHGYSELEYAICRELGKVGQQTKVVTTVHPLQIVNKVPVEPHDVPLDVIIVPDDVIPTQTKHPRPQGILWEKISDKMLEEMPVLRELSPRQS